MCAVACNAGEECDGALVTAFGTGSGRPCIAAAAAHAGHGGDCSIDDCGLHVGWGVGVPPVGCRWPILVAGVPAAAAAAAAAAAVAAAVLVVKTLPELLSVLLNCLQDAACGS